MARRRLVTSGGEVSPPIKQGDVMTPTETVVRTHYVMTGPVKALSDLDGPFNLDEAISHLRSLCGEFASPELINNAVVVYLENNVLRLYKDSSGKVFDGKRLFWERQTT